MGNPKPRYPCLLHWIALRGTRQPRMRQYLMFFRKMMEFLLIMSWSYTKKSLKALSTGLEQVIRIFASAIPNTCGQIHPKLSDGKGKASMKLRKTFNIKKRNPNLSQCITKNLPNAGPSDKDNFGNTTLQPLQQQCDLALTSWNLKVTQIFFHTEHWLQWIHVNQY